MTQGIADVLGEGALAEAAAEEAAQDGFSFSAQRFILHILAQRSATVVPRRDLQPVLKNFLITVSHGEAGDQLRMAATDLELAIVASVTSVTVTLPEGQESATTVLPAQKFLSILSQAPDGAVTVTVTGQDVAIEAGSARWSLRLSSDVAEYPDIPDYADTELHEVETAPFLEALQAVSYAVSTVKPHYGQVAMRKGPDGIMRATACDSTRLAERTLPGFPVEMCIPAFGTPRGVDELVRVLSGTQAKTVGVGLADEFLVFRAGGTVLRSTVLSYEFPDVDKLVLAPALDNTTELLADRAELSAAIKRVRINADDSTSAIGLVLSPGKLIIYSQDMYGATARQTLTVTYDGPERRLVVNHRFLSELLGACPAATCKFLLGKDTVKIRSKLLLTDAASGFTGVISQMAATALVGYAAPEG